jgi:hypothetical protein
VPTSVVFADPCHLAAGIDTDLPPSPATFGLLENSSEQIEAVISDANGDPLLASQALVTGIGNGILVGPGNTLGFSLAPQPSFDSTATFVGGLNGVSSTALTYDIEIVKSATGVTLKTQHNEDGSVFVLAEAKDINGNEVFGLPAWTFTLSGAGTALPVLNAAVKVIFPTGTAAQSVSLAATNGTLDAGILLP